MPKKLFPDRRTAVRVVFLLFQLAVIAIAVRTHGEITIAPYFKPLGEDYLHWFIDEYVSPHTWSAWFDAFAIVSSICFTVSIATIAELAYKRGELSGRQIFLCFALVGVARLALEFALCLFFEHYYRWWLLLSPELLAVTLLVLSETIEKKHQTTKKRA